MIHLTTRRKFNLFSWLIKKFMRTSYSHCGLEFKYFNISLIFEATAIFGVRIITKERWLENNIILESISVSPRRMKPALEYCMKQLGESYSYANILGIAFKDPKIGRDGTGSFQCSELIARALGLKEQNLDHLDVKELKELLHG